MRLQEIIHKNISSINIFDTLEVVKNFHINSLTLIKSTINHFNLYNQVGGKNETIRLNKNKYKYRIEEYEAYGGDYLFNLIKLGAKKNNQDEFDEPDICGYMIIDKKRNEATIQSLANYKDCLICEEKYIDFKTGDILMQIILIKAKKMGLVKLSLTDNSYFLCASIKISLIYLRTMTKGRPFYAKYKFTPIYPDDSTAFYKNNEIYDTNPTISKKQILKFINKINFDKESQYYKNIIKYINENLLPNLTDKNIIKNLITKLIYDSKNIKDICIFLDEIYMYIYNYAGYLRYKYKSFELILANLSIK